jgi:hypothetical protein
MPGWEMPGAPGSGVAWQVPLAFINYRNTDEQAAACIEAELTCAYCTPPTTGYASRSVLR